MKAIEVHGRIDQRQKLRVDESLPGTRPGKVRVLVLVPDDADINEQEWLRSAARNPVFGTLSDPSEDLYTIADGMPLRDEG
ncbi:MAG: hypothetical protein HY270_15505 [Deltaproteobacteria bacterium]|nr:hypothetical protein [Deltaproteobacteria bacterium]